MQGLILAIAAYSVWGCYPLYFTYLSNISPVEVLAHRIIWSLVTTLLVGLLLHRRKELLAALKNKSVLGWLSISAILIALHWLVYIWAVGQQRVVEASLGFFIAPVLSLILARIFFKENLHPLQAWAGGIAVVAILWEFISLGELPWISLVLAFAFASYGAIRKHCPVDGINGMTIETLWLIPFALIWIFWQSLVQPTTLEFGNNSDTTLLLIGSGILSALPLVLFAMATRRMDLSIVGFIMYINPTIQFLIGIFVLHEPYPPQRLITFFLIWVSLIMFMGGLWKLRSAKIV